MSIDMVNEKDIKEIHEVLQEINNDRRLRANQVAVVVADIENLKETDKSTYEAKKLKLQLENIFVDYAQTVHGCYFTLDTGEYAIFTTRGSIVVSTDNYKNISIIDIIKNEFNENIRMSCGIGYGKTSNEAQVNAKLGLFHSKENGGDCAFVISDEGSIRGPVGKSNEMEYI